MKHKNPDCLLRVGSSQGQRAFFGCRPVEARTTEAVHQLRHHTEDLALELTVRLRVLGKSLATACPGRGTSDGTRSGNLLAYQNLRRQFDDFLDSLVDRGFAGHHYFPVIRHYLQDFLPVELNGCIGAGRCRIEQVEAIISLLSASPGESIEFREDPLPPVSLLKSHSV